MPKQNGQHRTARAPKQRARECAGCTHSGVNRTRKGYSEQCLGAFGATPASERIQFSEPVQKLAKEPWKEYAGSFGADSVVSCTRVI